jgi:hypothetical protein
MMELYTIRVGVHDSLKGNRSIIMGILRVKANI